MGLGTYTPKARMQGDQKRVDHLLGRPLLVRVMEYISDFSSQRFPDAKPVVIVDFVDLLGDKNDGNSRIYIGSLWGANAVVDNLKDYAGDGQFYPVLPTGAKSQKSGNDYVRLDGIPEGPAMDFANWYYENRIGQVDEARNQKMAQAQAAQAQPTGPIQPQAPQAQFQAMGAPAQAQAPAAPQVPAPQPGVAPPLAFPTQQNNPAQSTNDAAAEALRLLNAG